MLCKLSKKNFFENIVPVLIGLKHTLEAKHSPLTRYLLHYIRELLKMYRHEVKDIFMNTDPQMAMEVEYDQRQHDLYQQQKQQSRRRANAPGDAQTAPISPQDELWEAASDFMHLRDEKDVTVG